MKIMKPESGSPQRQIGLNLFNGLLRSDFVFRIKLNIFGCFDPEYSRVFCWKIIDFEVTSAMNRLPALFICLLWGVANVGPGMISNTTGFFNWLLNENLQYIHR